MRSDNRTQPQLTVQASHPRLDAVAAELADQLDYRYAPAATSAPQGWRLLLDNDQRTLIRPDGASLCIDFTTGKAAHRRREAGLRRQPLPRAIGIDGFRQRTGRDPTIVDATAGLGQDAWLLAAMGCTVTMIECSSLLHALLRHAIDKAARLDVTAGIATRATVINADSIDWLGAATHPVADVIYLDPMYPLRNKSARVKKGMQFLHELLPPHPNDARLLPTALSAAGKRVVVKRPRAAEPLPGTREWQGQLTQVHSPNTRYDVYHMQCS